MKHRIFKKLCKKSAEIIGLDQCGKEDGIWFFCWVERGAEYTEYDAIEAWTWLVDVFDASVNTIIDHYSECGVSWKQSNQITKATPKNVFKWARKENLI